MGSEGKSIAVLQEIRDSLMEFRKVQQSLPKEEQRVCAVAGDTFGEAGQVCVCVVCSVLCEYVCVCVYVCLSFLRLRNGLCDCVYVCVRAGDW